MNIDDKRKNADEMVKEISERFNNGTETMEDIMNYCRNYKIQGKDGKILHLVEKKYFDKLKTRLREIEKEMSVYNGTIYKGKRVRDKDINSGEKLKLKDDVSPEKLKKFGFKEDKVVKDNYELVVENAGHSIIKIEITNQKILFITTEILDSRLKETNTNNIKVLYDLIKSDLIEKVGG